MILNTTYDRTLKRDEKSGKTLFTVRTNELCNIRNKYGAVLCSGYIQRYTKGAPLRIYGEVSGDKIEVVKVEEGTDRESVMIEYLSSGICKGIGPTLATKIVKAFGVNLFDILKEPNAEILLIDKVEGISYDKAVDLIRALRGTRESQEVLSYISKYSGTLVNALDICTYCGERPLTTFKRNVYIIGRAVNMDFAVCDRIAKSEGIPFYDNERIKIFTDKLLTFCTSSSGNTYTTLEDLIRTAAYIEEKESAFNETLTPAMIFNALINDENVVFEAVSEKKCRIYPKYLWNAEKKVAFELKRLENGKIKLDFDINNIAKDGISYDKKQLASLNLLKSTGVKIVTGGPGTGKTTTINKIISEYERMYPQNTISLCAPTGRAAQKVGEATKKQASTIHTLIEYKPFENYGNNAMHKGSDDPIDSNMIVVDEMSMTDIVLMSLLLPAVKTGTLLILVGDVNQLSSVGPGSVLRDLIEAEAFETYIFDKIFRQKEEAGSIVSNAYKIINGDKDLISDDNFVILKTDSEKDLQNKVLEYSRKYFDKNDLFKVQVLSSTKKYEAGVFELNRAIQKLVNGEGDATIIGGHDYRVNDKIMMTRNNSEKNYSNGDIGYIKAIHGGSITAIINKEEIELGTTEFDEMILAYSNTIHKSQGSEYPICIIALPKNPRIMLKRNLLYTAVTRAASKVVLLYVDGSLEMAIDNIDDTKRATALVGRIKGEQYFVYRKGVR